MKDIKRQYWAIGILLLMILGLQLISNRNQGVLEENQIELRVKMDSILITLNK